MNRLSIKVLRFIKKQSEPVSKDVIISKFGNDAVESIRFLEKEEYIKAGKKIYPHRNLNGQHEIFISNGKYEIAALGLDFLQHKPGRDFDRWLTRIIAIWGALTGTAALLIELTLHFLSQD